MNARPGICEHPLLMAGLRALGYSAVTNMGLYLATVTGTKVLQVVTEGWGGAADLNFRTPLTVLLVSALCVATGSVLYAALSRSVGNPAVALHLISAALIVLVCVAFLIGTPDPGIDATVIRLSFIVSLAMTAAVLNGRSTWT